MVAHFCNLALRRLRQEYQQSLRPAWPQQSVQFKTNLNYIVVPRLKKQNICICLSLSKREKKEQKNLKGRKDNNQRQSAHYLRI